MEASGYRFKKSWHVAVLEELFFAICIAQEIYRNNVYHLNISEKFFSRMSSRSNSNSGSSAFVSQYATRCLRAAYAFAVGRSEKEILRVVVLTVVVACFFLRTARLWIQSASLTAGPTLALASITLGLGFTIILSFLSTFLVLMFFVYHHPGDGIGHRVGYIGYGGAEIENTIGALQAMASADKAGMYEYANFPFIEFDIQETIDGDLVLFHDIGLRAAFPEAGPNLKPLSLLRQQGIDVRTATVQDITVEKLQTLHLGAREGTKVPTLAEFLE